MCRPACASVPIPKFAPPLYRVEEFRNRGTSNLLIPSGLEVRTTIDIKREASFEQTTLGRTQEKRAGPCLGDAGPALFGGDVAAIGLRPAPDREGGD